MKLKLSLNWLLALVPVAVGLEATHAPAPYIFFAAALGIVPHGLLLEERLQVGLLGSANQIEAVQANMQKRTPEFRDPA